MRLQLITPPETEPVSLEEQKLHTKIDYDTDDTLISGLITACREYCELYQSRAFITQTWRLTLNQFPCVINVPNPPLISIDSIEYRAASNGEWLTLDEDAYEVGTDGEPGLIYPIYGTWWPPVLTQLQSVKITFTCGYGDATAVPSSVKTAIRELVDHHYNVRTPVTDIKLSEVPFGICSLLDKGFWGDYR